MLPVKVTSDHIFVKTPYVDKELVKERLNGSWSKKEGMYRFPKNIHCLTELYRQYPQLRFNQEFIAAGQRLRKSREVFLDLKAKTDTTGDERLRPYQRVDVEYLRTVPSAGIFNEPRTGKTPTSILLIKELQTMKNLIVCPASLIWNWTKEFENWYNECEIFTISGTPKQRERTYKNYKVTVQQLVPSVLIISKDTWKSDLEKFGLDKWEFDTCFVDEAHFLRNRDTAQSKAIFDIKAERRYALTGTPTVKHGTDIFGILKFLYPKRFSSYWQFVERYWEVGKDWMGHAEIRNVRPERKQELQELIGFISVQRKRKEVMQWLPDKQRINHYCHMDVKQLKYYNEMLNDFVIFEKETETILDTQNVLSQLMRLRQLCLDPRLVGFDVPSCKTKALLEWLDNNREPVVIMSMFTSYFDLVKTDIEKLGLKVGTIHGKMSNQEKDQAARDFQAGKIDVLLCNIISAGVGFTLDKAETIIFMDKAWNPAENEQAEDRVTPTTEEKNHKHTIISFVVDETVDVRINNILDEKKSLTDVINEGGRNAIHNLLHI